MKENFIRAIQEKRLIEIEYLSKSKGLIKRICIPFDFGPSNTAKNKTDKYHFWDINSPVGSHVLSADPVRVKSIRVLDEIFNPDEYITWSPSWYIKRDWGNKS